MLYTSDGAIDWTAIGALSTALAAIVALGASWMALKAPEWARQAERREATGEVLQAAREAISIYRGAADLIAANSWPDDLVTLIRIRAVHLHSTLDRLISRPALTDGAIAVGAGTMSILAEIIKIRTSAEAREAAMSRSSDRLAARAILAVGPAKIVIDAAADVVKVVEDRAERVEKYLNRRWWHRLQRS